MAGPVEAKVWGATGGAAAGLALASLGLAIANHAVYHGQGVPDDIAQPVMVLVPLLVTWLGGWLAPHTVRTDPAATASLDGSPRPIQEPDGALVPAGVTTVNEHVDRPTFNNGDEDYRRALG